MHATKALQHIERSVLIQIVVLALEKVCMHVSSSNTLYLVRLTARGGRREANVLRIAWKRLFVEGMIGEGRESSNGLNVNWSIKAWHPVTSYLY